MERARQVGMVIVIPVLIFVMVMGCGTAQAEDKRPKVEQATDEELLAEYNRRKSAQAYTQEASFDVGYYGYSRASSPVYKDYPDDILHYLREDIKQARQLRYEWKEVLAIASAGCFRNTSRAKSIRKGATGNVAYLNDTISQLQKAQDTFREMARGHLINIFLRGS